MTGATVGGVFASVAILTVLFLPAINSARTTARQMQNSTQLRGVHQAMVTYAQGNEFWFPGATPDGKVNENAAISNRHGSIMQLQEDDFFEAEYNISPGEIDPSVSSLGLAATTPLERGSYAALEYATDGVGKNLSTLGMHEWRDTMYTRIILLSDRNTRTAIETQSIWSSDHWTGAVVFGDNHVQFELSDGPFGGIYGLSSTLKHTGTIGMLFDTTDGDGRMVQD